MNEDHAITTMMNIQRFVRWLGFFFLSFVLAFNVWAIDPPLGIGEVREIPTKESMSVANARYQTQAAGMPNGQGVAVGVDKSVSRPGYVKFDGINRSTSTLYDAKGFGYRVDKNGEWTNSNVSRKMQDKLRAQLNRQLAAARGANMKVEWRVPNANVKKGMDSIAKGRIVVTVVPPSQEVLDALRGNDAVNSL